jgi:hypothetical protein
MRLPNPVSGVQGEWRSTTMRKMLPMLAFVSAVALSGLLAACEDRNDTPAEKVGEAIEDAGDKVKDAVD